MSQMRSVRGRTGRGKEHIGVPPESGALWSRTVCGLTCLPQFPVPWDEIPEADKCWNCKAFYEHRGEAS